MRKSHFAENPFNILEWETTYFVENPITFQHIF